MSNNKEDTLQDWFGAAAVSAGFLTRLPIPGHPVGFSLTRAMVAFPVIGALIGAATGLAVVILTAFGVSTLAAAATALAMTCFITGALHEDGFADMADGFGGGRTKERKLEIMRDSRLGTYAVVSVVLILLTKAAALADIANASPLAIIGIACGCGALSRAAMVWLLHAAPAARADGLGVAAGQPRADVTWTAVGIGAGLAIIGIWWGCGLLAAVVAIGLAGVVALVIKGLATRQIGGQTGDVCGALQVIAETAMYLAVSAILP